MSSDKKYIKRDFKVLVQNYIDLTGKVPEYKAPSSRKSTKYNLKNPNQKYWNPRIETFDYSTLLKSNNKEIVDRTIDFINKHSHNISTNNLKSLKVSNQQLQEILSSVLSKRDLKQTKETQYKTTKKTKIQKHLVSESDKPMKQIKLPAPANNKANPEGYFYENYNLIKDILKNAQQEYKEFKFNILSFSVFINIQTNQRISINHESNVSLLRLTSNINTQLDKQINKIITDIFTKYYTNSAFIFSNLNSVYLNIFRVKPIVASSYFKFDFPFSKSIINPQNNDNKCFYYAVAYGMFPELQKIKHNYRVTVINKFLNENNYKIDDSMLSYPVPIDEKIYYSFEKANNINLKVFGTTDYYHSKMYSSNLRTNVFLIYKSKNYDKEHKDVNILLVEDFIGEEDKEPLSETTSLTSHYVFIKNLERLYGYKNNHKNKIICKQCLQVFWSEQKYDFHPCILNDQQLFNQKDALKGTSEYYTVETESIPAIVCDYCQNSFKSKEDLDIHKEKYCLSINNPRPINFPENDNLKFKNTTHTSKLPFYIVADFESVLSPLNKNKSDNLLLKDEQIPCSYCLKVLGEKDFLNEYIDETNKISFFDNWELEKTFRLYRGINQEDTMKHFIDDIIHLGQVFKTIFNKNEKMNLTLDDTVKFARATNCYLCHKPFVIDEEKYIFNYLNNRLNNYRKKQKQRRDLNIEDIKNLLIKCKESYKNCTNGKNRDHSHITGKYLGAACTRCNLLRKDKDQFVPLIFHNAKNYDLHHIINIVSKPEYNISISGINTNSEKSLSITLKSPKNEMCNIRIIDSLQLFGPGASLEKLTESLKKTNKESFKCMQEYFKDNSELVLRKNINSYSYFDSFHKFNTPISNLINKIILDNPDTEKIKVAQEVIKEFNIKTAGEYYDLYLKCDVLELADIIEFSRDKFINTHKLDFLYYYGAPGYSWDCFLFKSQIELEYLKDIDQVSFFKKMLRGGPSYIAKRYSKANNEYMGDLYNPNKPYIFIDYLDMNNLYGAAMLEPLPYSDFKWVDKKEIEELNNKINSLSPKEFNKYFFGVLKDYQKEHIGCCIEVDLEYPKHLHKLHNMYPLAPEKKQIKLTETLPCKGVLEPLSEAVMSDKTVQIKNKILLNSIEDEQIKDEIINSGYLTRKYIKEDKTELLVQTLSDKKEYKVYYKLLELYCSLGMVIKKIHRIITFKEKAFMKDYIEMNTLLRAEARKRLNGDSFESDLYKLLNNSIYGKTMENVFGYSNIKFVQNSEQFMKYSSKASFNKGIEINDNLWVVDNKGERVLVNKPLYIGPVITDIAKLKMYDFHYNFMIKEFGIENIDLLFTDTDSLVYEIRKPIKDHYKNLINKGVLDTSGYKIDNELLDLKTTKNNQIGKMKCDLGNNIITEFVGLRSKMYSYKLLNDKEEDKHLKLKGVNRKALNNISFNDYYNALFGDSEYYSQHVEMEGIRSFKHKIYTIKQNKVSLSSDDTKRYILEDNINTLAYGSSLIEK